MIVWKITSQADFKSPEHFSADYVGEFILGDDRAHEWSVNVKNADLDGCNAMAYVLRADGNTVPVKATITGNVVSAILHEHCYAVEGFCTAIMRLTDADGRTITIAAIKYRIDRKTTDSYVDSGGVIPSIDELLAQVARIEDAVNNANQLPYIGENGNWYNFDVETGEYVDSGMPSSGGGSGEGGAVRSVNGKTGAVELSATDVGALPEDTQIPDVSDFITRAVSDLLNYYTKSQTYTRDEIDQKVSAIPKFAISVVSALPSTGISATTIYLVPGGADDNLYTEYINVNGTWEILGSQRVDLTGYATQNWTLEQLKGYLAVAELAEAINTALAQAKASGEFDGEDGYTPVRYKDDWTEADQEAIVQQVIAALGTPVFGTVDENKHITLSGHLVDGTYTMSFEDTDGFTSEVCTINKAPVPTYTNLFDPATATLNTRMSGSSKAPKTENGYVMTAVIPIPVTAVVGSSTASENFVAVPSAMWTDSANMFLSYDTNNTSGYVDAGTTKGTVVGSWVKIPLVNQYGNSFNCSGLTLSLKVGGSALTESDIQNIEIYFNEIPE